MSTFRFESNPGSLVIVWRQSASADGTGSILPTRYGGRMVYLDFPDGGFEQWRAFGPTVTNHASSGALVAGQAVMDGDAARSGSAISHGSTGALVASAAIMSGAAARSGVPVSHATSGALVAEFAHLLGSASIGGAPVVHDTSGVLVAGPANLIECICVRPDTGITAYSGTVSLTRFNTRRVIDNAFRLCRLNAQQISAEMQDYAKDALYLQLSELANGKPPSWCIEKIILPMYQNQPIVPLPQGTVGVLNMNYRTIQALVGTLTETPILHQVQFDTSTQVAIVGIKWSCCATSVSFDVSADGVTWIQVGSQPGGIAGAHEWTWYDISAPKAWDYFRITSNVPMEADEIVLGNMPNEIPMGVLNRDDYVNQPNKIFPSRPTNYWFQRDLALPVVNIWPAPYIAAEHAQLILWRHRHVMDVGPLTKAIEVPQRWMKSVIASLAATLAQETPGVDPAIIPALDMKAMQALQLARDGDNDGAPSFYSPNLSPYTR